MSVNKITTWDRIYPFFVMLCFGICLFLGGWLYKTMTENIPKKQVEVIYDINDPFTEEKVRIYLTQLHVKYINVAIAQMKLESANGTSPVFYNNNLFGMKEAEKRATTALGTKNNHAYYSHWRQSVVDYALFQNYISSTENMESEDAYLNYVNRFYAEDDSYKKKLVKIIKTLKQ